MPRAASFQIGQKILPILPPNAAARGTVIDKLFPRSQCRLRHSRGHQQPWRLFHRRPSRQSRLHRDTARQPTSTGPVTSRRKLSHRDLHPDHPRPCSSAVRVLKLSLSRAIPGPLRTRRVDQHGPQKTETAHLIAARRWDGGFCASACAPQWPNDGPNQAHMPLAQMHRALQAYDRDTTREPQKLTAPDCRMHHHDASDHGAPSQRGQTHGDKRRQRPLFPIGVPWAHCQPQWACMPRQFVGREAALARPAPAHSTAASSTASTPSCHPLKADMRHRTGDSH